MFKNHVVIYLSHQIVAAPWAAAPTALDYRNTPNSEYTTY